MHRQSRLGELKCVSVAKSLAELNPDVEVRTTSGEDPDPVGSSYFQVKVESGANFGLF